MSGRMREITVTVRIVLPVWRRNDSWSRDV